MSGATVSSTANIGTLTDKIALITGASSGLGRAIAQAYAAAGAFIVSADITPNPPDAPLVQELLKETDLKTPTVDLINASFPSGKDGRPRAAFVKCDVTQSASVEAAVAFAVKQYGRLDIMVNNAGMCAGNLSSGLYSACLPYSIPFPLIDLSYQIVRSHLAFLS